MAKKKHYEYSDTRYKDRDSDGLKKRRLKEENRWKFNPNQPYTNENDDDEYDDDEYGDEYEQYRQGG